MAKKNSKKAQDPELELSNNYFNIDAVRSNLNELSAIKKMESDYSRRQIKLLNEELSKITSQQKNLEGKLDLQNKKISSDKNRTIETLGVFVALFTFISGQVQIFQKVTNPKVLVALTLVTGGLITFFVLILDLMIKTHDEAEGLLKLKFFLLLIISIGFTIAGTLLIARV